MHSAEDLNIESNTLDATVNADIVLRGAYASCPTDFGLTVKNNISVAPSKSPCGGSITAPPGCAIWEVEDYAAVTITATSWGRVTDSPATSRTPRGCPARP